MRAALARLEPVLLFALLPVGVVITMFVVGLGTGPLAHDFRNELYPQAKDILSGDNPYPEAIWPPFAAVVVMPRREKDWRIFSKARFRRIRTASSVAPASAERAAKD